MSTALLDYLQGLPGITLKKLYKQPSAALAILRRMLPHLAKHIVMVMIWMPEPFTEEDLHIWIRDESKIQREEAKITLERLHIISIVPETKPRSYRLHNSFANSLRQALTGTGSSASFGKLARGKTSKVSIEILDNWARGQWESLLYFMVGTAGGTSQPEGIPAATPSMESLLKSGEFIALKGPHVNITKEGFAFLLEETHTQVWRLMIVYLHKGTVELGMDQDEMLAFLFTLGSMELSQAYSSEDLSETQKVMVDDLTDLGILYCPPSANKEYFFPTRLATTLTSSDSLSLLSHNDSNGPKRGHIVLETNHRIYAYTSSPLQVAIISLFTNLHSRFPNLVSGKLSKESIIRALSFGITSAQIIQYLSSNAHPQLLKKIPILPPTVVDQIRLWQLEGDRMKATPGFLLKEFTNKNEYIETAEYAETLGVLMWRNDEKLCFFVTRVDQLQVFLKNRNNSATSNSISNPASTNGSTKSK